MRARKLSEQQTRRIAQNHTHKQTLTTLSRAKVLANFGKQLLIQTTASDSIAINSLWRAYTRTGLPPMCAGDDVGFFIENEQAQIEALHPRTSVIFRPDRYHKQKPIAANVDMLAIVIAPEPIPSPLLIDRYLVACHHANIAPCIILNKIDLLDSANLSYDLDNLLAYYDNLGVPILRYCQGQSTDALANFFIQKQSILSGQSGVGKSSLANALLGSEQAVNAISTISRLGQHTTTTSRLLPFDSQDLSKGALIDTPGIREYGLWHLSPQNILQGFIEFAPLVHECRFRDCTHDEKSINCALIAFANTHARHSRLHNLRALLNESMQK